MPERSGGTERAIPTPVRSEEKPFAGLNPDCPKKFRGLTANAVTAHVRMMLVCKGWYATHHPEGAKAAASDGLVIPISEEQTPGDSSLVKSRGEEEKRLQESYTIQS